MQAMHHRDHQRGSLEELRSRPVIWLIRHGESETNAGLATTHTKDVRLTDRGQRQAEEVAKAFTREPTLIISSSYKRAQETAEPTRLCFPTARYEIWPVHEFTYLGSLNGILTTRQDRRARVNEFWEQCDPTLSDEEGESFLDFFRRTWHAVNRLKAREEEFIVIFSHEQFMRAIQWLMYGWRIVTPESMQTFRHQLTSSPLPNGHILEICWLPRQQMWQESYVDYEEPLSSYSLFSTFSKKVASLQLSQ